MDKVRIGYYCLLWIGGESIEDSSQNNYGDGSQKAALRIFNDYASKGVTKSGQTIWAIDLYKGKEEAILIDDSGESIDYDDPDNYYWSLKDGEDWDVVTRWVRQ